jgi:hypothetical protein
MNNLANFAERILAMGEARRGRISDGYVTEEQRSSWAKASGQIDKVIH